MQVYIYRHAFETFQIIVMSIFWDLTYKYSVGVAKRSTEFLVLRVHHWRWIGEAGACYSRVSNVLKSTEKQSELLEFSALAWVSAVEGCLLRWAPLHIMHVL